MSATSRQDRAAGGAGLRRTRDHRGRHFNVRPLGSMRRLVYVALDHGHGISKGRSLQVEYSRVRDTLETLTDRMQKLTEEFDRRAGVQWASASQG